MRALRLLPEDGRLEGAAREVDGEVVDAPELEPVGRAEHPQLTEQGPGERAVARADLEDAGALLPQARRWPSMSRATVPGWYPSAASVSKAMSPATVL